MDKTHGKINELAAVGTHVDELKDTFKEGYEMGRRHGLQIGRVNGKVEIASMIAIKAGAAAESGKLVMAKILHTLAQEIVEDMNKLKDKTDD